MLTYEASEARRAAGTARKHVIALTEPQVRVGLQEAVEDELVVVTDAPMIISRMLTDLVM